jgi:hypothetical protein
MQAESTGAPEEFWGKACRLYGKDTFTVRGSEVARHRIQPFFFWKLLK